jgi:hypothetical protein
MLCLLGLCMWMLVNPRALEAPKILLVIMAVLIFGPLSDAVMDWESNSFPMKYDYFLYLVDKNLGVSAFSLARLLTEWQRSILFIVYQSLVYVMILWYIVSLKRKDGKPRTLLTAYLVNFLTGPCLYLIVPARGPRHAFGNLFPAGNPDVAPVLVRLGGWPNAIPSLHVSTALLFVLFAGESWVLRCFAWSYLAGTVAATLAFEHYLIDLVIAAPFACFAALAAKGEIRKASGNIAVVLAWLLSIRFGTPALLAYPAVLPIAALATIAFAGFSMTKPRKSGVADLSRPEVDFQDRLYTQGHSFK